MAAQPAILQMLSGAASPQTAGLAQIRETVAKLRVLKDPKAGMQMLMQQRNPGMAQAMDYIKQHGGDAKAAFEALAKMLIAETGSNLAAQIAQNKYENALALAGMEQRITAKMDQNEITSLRDQIGQLQLAQATAGVLRFPSQWSYGAGPFPPIFGGCPGNNI